jgi:class 3 adenylate cyclase
VNPYALPPIIAFTILLMLSLAVISQDYREKSNRLLFALCLGMALSNGASGMLHLSSNEAQANIWNKWPYIFGVISFIIEIEYILQVSDRVKRLKETLIGVSIAAHRRVIYVLISVTLLILCSTDLLVAPPRYYSSTGWEHEYGHLFMPYMGFNIYMMVCRIFIIYRGIKSASNPIEKRMRKITFAAFFGFDLYGFIFGVFLPFTGLQVHSFYSIGPIYMCFLMTYGLLRMHWETIKDLKNELEEKVALRTQALKAANKRLQEAQQQISKYIDPNVTEKIFKGEFSAELSHQRKKLTLFFSDIKDFTQFTDAADPEDVARLLNEYLGEMAWIVRKWGGTIPQFTGDSIFAIFGAPDSKGEREDALSCLRMALEMQQRMKTLQEKWWHQGIQFPFRIRCGIHTGMANVGNYGSAGFMEYSAIGLNTNLAARLEQACEPREIYLSHATWALVNKEIPCDEVGTIEVKGFHYPIRTYRVLQDEIEFNKHPNSGTDGYVR